MLQRDEERPEKDLCRSLLGHGVRLQGLIVHHDQGAVFTDYAWTAQFLLKDRVRLLYVQRGARDNRG